MFFFWLSDSISFLSAIAGLTLSYLKSGKRWGHARHLPHHRAYGSLPRRFLLRVRPFGHAHFCPISNQPYLTDSVRHFPALRPSYEASAQYKQQYGPKTDNRFRPSLNGSPATMASADFCQPIPKPLSFGSRVQVDRSTRVRHATFTLMPASSTSVLSVQVSGFEDNGLLTQYDRLICDFCPSSQCFACSFLQPISHDINLAVRLAVPLVGPAEDFHLQVSNLSPQQIG